MKNIKEIIRGNDSTELEFTGKRSVGSLSFKNETFEFTHPVIVPGGGDPGLENVDNTADIDKPISNDVQAALDGKVDDTFIQTVPTGDDAGVKITGELAIGTWDNPKETVMGQGDSTTETMMVLHTIDDVNFTDNTIPASSDDGSPLWLFGGGSASITTGSTIYVGGDFIFSGVKAKILTDGIVEPANVIAEYWTGSQWQQSTYMTSNANPPLHSHGNQLAQHGHEAEQWRFNFDPYEQFPDWIQNQVNGTTKYWARFRIISPITQDVRLEQIKLHTSRFEVNATGEVEFFGSSRVKRTLLSGVDALINNTASSAANQDVTYIAGEVVADYSDNRFVDGGKESKLFVMNVDEGLDTSIPVEVKISYYVNGIQTGDVEMNIGKIPVVDGFIYDGSATYTATYTTLDQVITPSNLERKTITIYVDISEGDPNTGYLMDLYRAHNGSANDTLNQDIVITHVVVNGYFWKP